MNNRLMNKNETTKRKEIEGMTKSTGKRKTVVLISQVMAERLAAERIELDKHRALVMLSEARIEVLLEVQEHIAIKGMKAAEKKGTQNV